MKTFALKVPIFFSMFLPYYKMYFSTESFLEDKLRSKKPMKHIYMVAKQLTYDFSWIFRVHTHTQQKMNNLFQVDENSIEQYFAAHIVLGC